MTRISEFIASQKATAWGISAVSHAGILYALVLTPGINFDERPTLDGRPSAVVLQTAMTPQQSAEMSELEMVLDVDVTVQPERVEIDRRELLPVVVNEPPRGIKAPKVAMMELSEEEAESEKPDQPAPKESTVAATPPPRSDVAAMAAVSPDSIGVKPITFPNPVHNPPPIYPSQARAEQLAGRVVLSLEVDIEGRVHTVKVAHGSGHSILDASAIRAVRTWRFDPAQRAGQPVAWSGQLPVRFILE